MWRVANGRFSITDGDLTLIVPYHKGQAGVQEALDKLNARKSGGGQRICAKCKTALKRYHKWRFTADSRVEHLDCERPEVYA